MKKQKFSLEPQYETEYEMQIGKSLSSPETRMSIIPFLYSFYMYHLIIYCVSGTVLGAEDTRGWPMIKR